MAYLSMGDKERAGNEEDGSNIFFDNNLGLAVEALPATFSTADLWEIPV
jgi:hypothetical protein